MGFGGGVKGPKRGRGGKKREEISTSCRNERERGAAVYLMNSGDGQCQGNDD